MALWEVTSPKRQLGQSKTYRWSNNFALVVLDTVFLRIAFPAAAVGVAIWAEQQNIGWLNNIAVPSWLVIVIGLVMLDFLIWLQHLVFHHVPPLWRLHRVHHTDTDIDVSTGLRFHPLEILLSMLIKAAVILILGLPAVAIILFEIILNASAMFNHSNVRLPEPIDRILRKLIVTPDMHRVHHSWHKDETNSNFGFNLSIWDKLFRTYTAQPRDGHSGMTIGLHEFREAKNSRVDHLIVQPFARSSKK